MNSYRVVLTVTVGGKAYVVSGRYSTGEAPAPGHGEPPLEPGEPESFQVEGVRRADGLLVRVENDFREALAQECLKELREKR